MFRGTNKIRIRKLKLIFLILLIALAIRIIQIQAIKGDHYEDLADKQYYYSPIVSEQKYQLLDSNGVYLNKSTKHYKIIINRKLFKLNDYEANLDKIMLMNLAIKRVNNNFDLDAELEKGYGDIYLELDQEGYVTIKEIYRDIKGVMAYSYEVMDNSKYWPIENMITTMYKNDVKGKLVQKSKDSLEGQIDSLVKDNSVTKAKFQVEKSGYIAPVGYTYPEIPYVNLTLDSRFQNKIKAVMEGDEFTSFSNIGAVLMEASTGKVKAFVQKDDTLANINIAAGGTGYEPASTFKLMIGELGLENNIIKENELYLCKGVNCKLYGEKHPHGLISFKEAIKLSCNDYFVNIANQLPYEKIFNFAKEQGYFSKVLNIDQEGEGSYKEPESYETNKDIAMGYKTPATPVQLAASLSAILNEGTYIKPYIVDSLSDFEGNILKSFESERKKVISKETADILKKAMRGTVQSGTGYRANIASMEIGGKTGTANGNGWFAGYYKQNESYYILTVLVQDLRTLPDIGEEYSGGNTAAVVFREIIKAINEE